MATRIKQFARDKGKGIKFYFVSALHRHNGGRARLYRDFAATRSLEIENKYAAKIDAFDYNLKREQLGAALYDFDEETAFNTAVEPVIARKKTALRLKYRARRETLKRAVTKGKITETAAAEALAAAEAENERLLGAFRERLTDRRRAAFTAEYNAARSSAGRLSADDFDAAKTAQVLAYAARQKARCAQKKEVFVRRNSARTARYERREARYLNILRNTETAVSVGLDDGAVLSVRDLCMYFGGIKAVDGLNFDVRKGEIFGLIGPNGAGKTTVFNCITQFYKPTRGEIYFTTKEGKVILLNKEKVHDVILRGIVRTFQNVEVIKEVSVLENLLISAHRQYTSNLFEQMLHLPVLAAEEAVIKARALKVLEFMGLLPYMDWYAFGLPYGVLKKIEIARTLMNNPQLIILDEPAAGLNDTETAELSKLIRRIAKEYDCTILLVEHDMGLVMEVCDRILAIAFGRMLAIGTAGEIQADKSVQAAYLGVDE
ncbi:MAG: ATP-binding cassette domain-containing protein [Clostridiales bacterium]|jgi:branched-chain amino acid transport system ATP-binding protein|nr:ATP-binding cassette domain-containing protein [Clostridiales bacterium]